MVLKRKNVNEEHVQVDGYADQRQENRSFEQLIDDLSSTNNSVRRLAISGLIGKEYAHEAFIAQLYIEDDPTVIEALFNGLSQSADGADTQRLISLLKSEKVQLRNGAIEFMQQHPELFAEHVHVLMQDDDPDTRIFCADIIGAVAHPKALDWLHYIVLNDENENVVGTALDKLAEVADLSSAEILDAVSKRFPHQPYIQFVISLTQEQLRGD